MKDREIIERVWDRYFAITGRDSLTLHLRAHFFNRVLVRYARWLQRAEDERTCDERIIAKSIIYAQACERARYTK